MESGRSAHLVVSFDPVGGGGGTRDGVEGVRRLSHSHRVSMP